MLFQAAPQLTPTFAGANVLGPLIETGLVGPEERRSRSLVLPRSRIIREHLGWIKWTSSQNFGFHDRQLGWNKLVVSVMRHPEFRACRSRRHVLDGEFPVSALQIANGFHGARRGEVCSVWLRTERSCHSGATKAAAFALLWDMISLCVSIFLTIPLRVVTFRLSGQHDVQQSPCFCPRNRA